MSRCAVAAAFCLTVLVSPASEGAEPAAPSAEERGSARQLLQAGKEAFRQGRFDEAAKLFAEAYEKDRSLDAALFNLAYALRRAERFQEARDAYARYLEKNPSDLDTVYALGRTEQLLGDVDAARRWYAQYVEKEARPDRARYVEHAKQQLAALGPPPAPVEEEAPAKAPYDADARFATAMTLFKAKSYREAAAIFLEVYEADNARSKALYRHALSLRQAGDLDAARAAYERFLASSPKDPDGIYGLAETERAAKKTERAIGLYERYIEIEQRPSEARWVRRAREYVAALKASLAAPPAPASVVVPPAVVTPPPVVEPPPAVKPPPAFVYRGPGELHRPVLAHDAAVEALVADASQHLDEGRPEAALKGFSLALAQAPHHARAAEGRAAAADALAAARGDAPTAGRDEVTVLLEEGEGKLAGGDAEGALKAFQRAHALAPSLAAPHWGLARAYEKAGFSGPAKHHYRLYRSSTAPDRDEAKADEAWWKLEGL